MLRSRFTICIVSAAVLFGGSYAAAQVGDPTIETDHRQYPGEGALQTVEQVVARAVAGKTSPQEQAVAMFEWMLTHQFHLMSPQEWNVPGKQPDTKTDDQEMIVYDANRARFSYGYGLCGTVHAWNEPYWKALGMNARRRAFPGHTNSEIEYDGSWHAFDTDMAGLVFRRDGVVAGYDDVIADPTLVDNDRSPLPRYPFAWPADFNGMKKGWRDLAKRRDWHKLYNGGYAAQPGIVQLRAGETFTRYFDRDHFGGPAERRFWHDLPGGPFRDWTFCNMGVPAHRGEKSNSRGNASYCNGEFVYEPDLAELNRGESAVFEHFSPYVICGKPADGANPMTGKAVGGMLLSGHASGDFDVEISADQGRSWNPAGRVRDDFTKDCTDFVKGRYGWQVRLTRSGPGKLESLTLTTITQVAQPIYPRLRSEGSEVVYRAGGRAVIPVLPDLAEPPREEEKKLRSHLTFNGKTAQQRLAYQTTGNKPGHVALRVEAPETLVQVTGAARFSVRSPSPAGCDFRLEVSTDGGKSWKPFGTADIPADNEYSSGWVYGAADISAAQARSALVRVQLYAGGYQTGLISLELYGVQRTPPPQAVELTYAWKEAGETKTHREVIPAGATEHKFRVPTGKAIQDEFIRLRAPRG